MDFSILENCVVSPINWDTIRFDDVSLLKPFCYSNAINALLEQSKLLDHLDISLKPIRSTPIKEPDSVESFKGTEPSVIEKETDGATDSRVCRGDALPLSSFKEDPDVIKVSTNFSVQETTLSSFSLNNELDFTKDSLIMKPASVTFSSCVTAVATATTAATTTTTTTLQENFDMMGLNGLIETDPVCSTTFSSVENCNELVSNDPLETEPTSSMNTTAFTQGTDLYGADLNDPLVSTLLPSSFFKPTTLEKKMDVTDCPMMEPSFSTNTFLKKDCHVTDSNDPALLSSSFFEPDTLKKQLDCPITEPSSPALTENGTNPFEAEVVSSFAPKEIFISVDPFKVEAASSLPAASDRDVAATNRDPLPENSNEFPSEFLVPFAFDKEVPVPPSSNKKILKTATNQPKKKKSVVKATKPISENKKGSPEKITIAIAAAVASLKRRSEPESQKTIIAKPRQGDQSKKRLDKATSGTLKTTASAPVSRTVRPNQQRPSASAPVSRTMQPNQQSPSACALVSRTVRPNQQRPSACALVSRTVRPNQQRPSASAPVSRTVRPNQQRPPACAPVSRTVRPNQQRDSSPTTFPPSFVRLSANLRNYKIPKLRPTTEQGVMSKAATTRTICQPPSSIAKMDAQMPSYRRVSSKSFKTMQHPLTYSYKNFYKYPVYTSPYKSIDKYKPSVVPTTQDWTTPRLFRVTHSKKGGLEKEKPTTTLNSDASRKRSTLDPAACPKRPSPSLRLTTTTPGGSPPKKHCPVDKMPPPRAADLVVSATTPLEEEVKEDILIVDLEDSDLEYYMSEMKSDSSGSRTSSPEKGQNPFCFHRKIN